MGGSQVKTNTSNGHAELAVSPKNRVCLLVGRAIAQFSAGGRASKVCKDLGDGFSVHPATARQQLQSLFSDNGIGLAARIQQRQQVEKGDSDFRVAVLAWPDLRSSKGLELLDAVIAQLRALCHLESDGGGRELRVRLADCLLLHGEHREVLSISCQLASAAPGQQSYQNTLQVLRGFSCLLIKDHKGALEDFQAVIEHNAPHPPSRVHALFGRGILHLMADSHYLTALDYVTVSQLQLQDTALTVRTAVGVHALALLLMELQPGADGSQILIADTLYQLGRVEEAYRLLFNIEHTAPRPPLLKKLIFTRQNTSRKTLSHRIKTYSVWPTSRMCHKGSCGLFVHASGGGAIDSLLERARCYALLGQWKTAIFDFTGILKGHPDHVQALCGRGFTYLMLNQQKASQRKCLAQAASQEARSVSKSDQWEHALALLTLTVRAVNEVKLQYLRQRAACLAHLGLHERAVSDLNKVMAMAQTAERSIGCGQRTFAVEVAAFCCVPVRSLAYRTFPKPWTCTRNRHCCVLKLAWE
ncbi:tetratricopeptide repeat protein 34 [Myxocyprinus asiaticus]|uniref:tetratricopeptide repeat protein 34 n=1 Tax=Myxocyprinus asiaticus TaxID=70543 RepID=UPI002222BA1F|nr:tetratricopeptide repeat protein 34 [Myxocyprinus asiaticus]